LKQNLIKFWKSTVPLDHLILLSTCIYFNIILGARIKLLPTKFQWTLRPRIKPQCKVPSASQLYRFLIMEGAALYNAIKHM
jgi:hypothetical protein